MYELRSTVCVRTRQGVVCLNYFKYILYIYIYDVPILHSSYNFLVNSFPCAVNICLHVYKSINLENPTDPNYRVIARTLYNVKNLLLRTVVHRKTAETSQTVNRRVFKNEHRYCILMHLSFVNQIYNN